jgi:hypothetical protein
MKALMKVEGDSKQTLCLCCSVTTGKRRLLTLNIPLSKFQKAQKEWLSGVYLQDALPMLSPDERELLLTGVSPEEWAELFGSEEEGEEEGETDED